MPRGYVQRTRGNYNPKNDGPFRVSRSKIALFMDCPRCFYLDQRLGVTRPSFPAFSLNNAVDELFKREFDIHRSKGEAHPLMKAYGLDAVPFNDPRMDEWRDALRQGVQYFHEPTNLTIRGGVDDIWVDKTGKLIVVDYKATSKKEEVTLDGFWQQGYKRQVEVYQWLLRQNGFDVSDTAYFVYANGNSDAKAFDAKLEFDVQLIPYEGDTAWIEPTITKLAECLNDDRVPSPAKLCEYCGYREAAGKALQNNAKERQSKLLE
jgi:CRISPR/Cas system-associated exonuclease Cas4 (RecB family)